MSRINGTVYRPFQHDDSHTDIDQMRPVDTEVPAAGQDDGTYECRICGYICDELMGVLCEHAQVNEDDGKEAM